jgi:nucleoside-diphosphate-sugar epimerase
MKGILLMNILVTGSSGLIGSEAVESFDAEGPRQTPKARRPEDFRLDFI